MALELPGFGVPRPAGFGATKDEYVDWLVGELDRLDGPIDLIGHDWGAGLTYRVAEAHGDRIHAWSADVANVMHADYVWHDVAQIWQTPGHGEAFFQAQLASPPEDQVQIFEAFGVPHDDAVELAQWPDETMGACILDLYRSATPNPAADWGVGGGQPRHRGSCSARPRIPSGTRRCPVRWPRPWAPVTSGWTAPATGGPCRRPRLPPHCSTTSSRRSTDGGRRLPRPGSLRATVVVARQDGEVGPAGPRSAAARRSTNGVQRLRRGVGGCAAGPGASASAG